MLYLSFSITLLDAQPSYIYEGGSGAGFSSDDLEADNPIFYAGANGGGHYSADLTEANLLLYKGGNNQGYSSIEKVDVQTDTYFQGGQSDGYAFAEKYEDFIWTGAIGTGWSVDGNWNFNIVPDLKRRAIIPAGVPNFPFVNAGIFAIGNNPNNGAFECGQLWIQDGAVLATRTNNFVENYSLILIDGTMQVKNPSNLAFQNFSGGVIRVSTTGDLLIKP